MFLAIREMRDAKLRYSLIIGVLFLIAFVVFLLSGLASGLANEFDKAVKEWDADYIVLNSNANEALAASQLTVQDYNDIDHEEKVSLGVYNGVLDPKYLSPKKEKKKKEKENITIFGTTPDAFLLPNVIKGRTFEDDHELMISKNLADLGLDIGDTLILGDDNLLLTVVGIFPESFYMVTPVAYTSLTTWRDLKYGDFLDQISADKAPISAVVTKGAHPKVNNMHDSDNKLQIVDIQTFIEKLPGYSAQKLTLNSMIYFMFVIVAAIIGIFMYVITLQKTAVFGVMKAQGVATKVITHSLLIQAFIVSLIGSFLAFIVTILLSFILPESMPFAVVWDQWLLYAVILLIVSLIGSLFSLRTIKKVDPVTAIGGII